MYVTRLKIILIGVELLIDFITAVRFDYSSTCACTISKIIKSLLVLTSVTELQGF